MTAVSSWSLTLALACAVACALATRAYGRWLTAAAGALGAAYFAWTLRGWEEWEFAVRRIVYGLGRAQGLTLDRALEASLAAAVCAVVATLHRAARGDDGARVRQAVLGLGALWGLIATAQFGWLLRAT